jgi:murein DD-endopeptidase MepM/ murein hydrolase activator NlpD
MQLQIGAFAAALGLLAFPPGSSPPEPPAPSSASPWVLHGTPTRVRTEPLNANVRAEPPSTPPEHAFPVHGSHDFGTGVNGFGGGRGHDGQDIFAGCGTPVVAARAGKVVEVDTGGAEGNYVVLRPDDGRQQAYLHLLHPRSVRRGEWVSAGDRIGSVGQTGNAQGCHLHFELWTAGGRFTGGRAVDPRAALERWDR